MNSILIIAVAVAISSAISIIVATAYFKRMYKLYYNQMIKMWESMDEIVHKCS